VQISGSLLPEKNSSTCPLDGEAINHNKITAPENAIRLIQSSLHEGRINYGGYAEGVVSAYRE
jgi:hypothetical protein